MNNCDEYEKKLKQAIEDGEKLRDFLIMECPGWHEVESVNTVLIALKAMAYDVERGNK